MTRVRILVRGKEPKLGLLGLAVVWEVAPRALACEL